MFNLKYRMNSYGKSMLITMAVVLFSISSFRVTADDDSDDNDNNHHAAAVDDVFHTDCRTDDECQNTQKCYKKKCMNVCHLPRKLFKLKCSYAAVCYVSAAHTAGCQCLSGFTGDPYGNGGCEQADSWDR